MLRVVVTVSVFGRFCHRDASAPSNGPANARASASEEGLASGPGYGPDRCRCLPLLESCGAESLATRRLRPANGWERTLARRELGLRGFPFINTLDMHGLDTVSLEPVVRDPSDRPEQAPLAHRLADGRNREPGEVVLVVTVGEADDERSCGYGTPRRLCALEMPASFRRKTANGRVRGPTGEGLRAGSASCWSCLRTSPSEGRPLARQCTG